MASSVSEAIYSNPPFQPEVQLNADPLKWIPGEFIPIEDAKGFLDKSLTQKRLDAIYKHLWFAGAPKHFRPLHKQHIYRRQIFVTEDPTLHLVWFSDAIYIQPLPPCLTNYEFFLQRVCVSAHERGSQELFGLACGLLYSYVKLVKHESDFRIAVEKGLLRAEGLTWEKWQKFRLPLKKFFREHSSVIHRRYQYGELRLSRLNAIYFLAFGEVQGYHNVYTRYAPYFGRYFTAAVLIFAFMSVTLNAMQVIMQTFPPNVPSSFVTACYRASIAILFGVGIITAVIAAVFIPVVIVDLRSGLVEDRKMTRDLRRNQEGI